MNGPESIDNELQNSAQPIVRKRMGENSRKKDKERKARHHASSKKHDEIKAI